MIKRLKIALFSPREIINMRVDNFGLVFLYILILSFIMMIPAAISVARFDGVSFDTRLKVEEAFNGKEVPYEIINYRLVKTSEVTSSDYVINDNMMISFSLGEVNAPPNKTNYRIVFGEESINIYCYIGKSRLISTLLFRYSDYEELKNVNLTQATSALNYDFWNNIFSVVNKEIKKYIPFATVAIIVGYTFTNLFLIMLLALVLALFQRLGIRRILSFKESYTISCYALSPFVVCVILAELFGISFLYYVGLTLAVVYNMIASNQILVKPSDRR